MGAYSQKKTACTIPTSDTQKQVTTGSFVGDSSICTPYFKCMPGYYKQFPSATCEPCTNPLPTDHHVYATSGLTDNMPTSCLTRCPLVLTKLFRPNCLTPHLFFTRCQFFDTWPDGACQGIQTNAYTPTNPPGF